MAYILTKNDNTFIINTNGGNTIYVTVYTQTYCGSNTWDILIPEQSTNSTLSITLPNEDNLYRIRVTDKLELDEYHLISIYKEFLKSFIENVEFVLCNCNCSDCEDCGKTEKDYISALLKMVSYNIINESLYNEYLTATNNCVKCTVLDTNQCLFLNETILGKEDNLLLLKKIIAYYYLVFYYVDLKNNENNQQNVKDLYKYTTIMKCIKRLNIDDSCIQEIILPFVPEGIFTIEFNNTFV